MYDSINNIKLNILNGDTSISINLLSSNIRMNKDKIVGIRKDLSFNKREKKVVLDSIEKTEARIKLYTLNISLDKIEKAKEKANKKQLKGKELKGRLGKIYNKITKMETDNLLHSSKLKKLKNEIINQELEITARENLIKILEEKSLFLLDLQAMQKQYIKINKVPSINFDTLCNYIINEEIKITTILKEGKYTLPTLPNEWKKSLIEAEMLLEKSLQKVDLLEINRQYTLNKGKWRRLTKQESEIRGLYVKITIPVVDTIFYKEYLEKRQENLKNIIDMNEYLDQSLSDYLKNIIYIPFAYEDKENNIKKKYRFDTKYQKNDEGKYEYYCKISVNYDDVFFGLDEEYKTIQTKKEKETASIGSLIDAYQTDLYANWGEK